MTIYSASALGIIHVIAFSCFRKSFLEAGLIVSINNSSLWAHRVHIISYFVLNLHIQLLRSSVFFVCLWASVKDIENGLERQKKELLPRQQSDRYGLSLHQDTNLSKSLTHTHTHTQFTQRQRQGTGKRYSDLQNFVTTAVKIKVPVLYSIG